MQPQTNPPLPDLETIRARQLARRSLAGQAHRAACEADALAAIEQMRAGGMPATIRQVQQLSGLGVSFIHSNLRVREVLEALRREQAERQGSMGRNPKEGEPTAAQAERVAAKADRVRRVLEAIEASMRERVPVTVPAIARRARVADSVFRVPTVKAALAQARAVQAGEGIRAEGASDIFALPVAERAVVLERRALAALKSLPATIRPTFTALARTAGGVGMEFIRTNDSARTAVLTAQAAFDRDACAASTPKEAADEPEAVDAEIERLARSPCNLLVLPRDLRGPVGLCRVRQAIDRLETIGGNLDQNAVAVAANVSKAFVSQNAEAKALVAAARARHLADRPLVAMPASAAGLSSRERLEKVLFEAVAADEIAGLTKREIAERAGVSLSTVYADAWLSERLADLRPDRLMAGRFSELNAGTIRRWNLESSGLTAAQIAEAARRLRDWEGWCKGQGFKSSPVTAAQVQAFLADMAQRGWIDDKLARARNAINTGHRCIGCIEPMSGRRASHADRGGHAGFAPFRRFAECLMDPAWWPPHLDAHRRNLLALGDPMQSVRVEERGTALPPGRGGMTQSRVVQLLSPSPGDLPAAERAQASLVALEELAMGIESCTIRPSTREGYTQQLCKVVAFCRTQNLEVLPMSVQTARLCLAWVIGLRAAERPYAVSVIQTVADAIRHVHAIRDLTSPTDHPRVRRLLQAYRASYPTPPSKARVLTLEEIKQIAAYWQQRGDLRAIRNRALLLTQYAACGRPSEVTTRRGLDGTGADGSVVDISLDIENISFNRKGAKLVFIRTKTTGPTDLLVKWIGYGEDGDLCPIEALQAWLKVLARFGIQSGAVFRGLRSVGPPEDGDCDPTRMAILPQTWGRELKMAAIVLGLKDADRVSGHSLRRSHATNALANGAPINQVQKQGGWKSLHTVGTYADEVGGAVDNSSLFVWLAS
jgi:integrase